MGGQHPQAWAGRGRSSCSATALWSLPGSLTMTLSASSMWGERGNAGVRWTGAGPLARIAVFGTFRQLRSFGTRCPPLSVWCGPHLCTSSYFCRSRPPLPTYSATPPPPDPIIPDATHPTCLSALPTTPVYRSRACRGATVGPSVADLCTLGDLPTCGIFVSCVPPVVP